MHAAARWTPPGKPGTGRDHRVDALRGVALAMMFIDHIPENLLNRVTIRNLGFCDAAEIFVLLAGFASMLAYGRTFGREGFWAGVGKIARRCAKLYVYQIGMLLLSIVVVIQWRRYHPVPDSFLEPELSHGFEGLWRAMSLQGLPSNFNILPLYIVLLSAFPLVYYSSRVGLRFALVASGALWALVNLHPEINLPNWFSPNGWYFDPFGWQFLFTLGALAAAFTQARGGHMPRARWLVGACWTYLALSAVQSFPWTQWGLPNLAPLAIPPPSKTPLSPLRLIDVLAIFYLVQSSMAMSRAAATRGGQALAVLGRHSLEVFSAGTVLDMLAKLLFTTFGKQAGSGDWALQVGVNVIGLSCMFLLARLLDRRKTQRRQGAVSMGGGPAADQTRPFAAS